MEKEITIEERIRQEELVREKKDEKGVVWYKVYFGGGEHYKGWLAQCKELYGEGNIIIEEIDPAGCVCFEKAGEKLYRIWAKKDAGAEHLFP
jgi:hypothetical protein